MKVTVKNADSNLVGRRILIPLHTHDVEIARRIRDGIIVALHKANVLSRAVEIEDDCQGDNF